MKLVSALHNLCKSSLIFTLIWTSPVFSQGQSRPKKARVISYEQHLKEKQQKIMNDIVSCPFKLPVKKVAGVIEEAPCLDQKLVMDIKQKKLKEIKKRFDTIIAVLNKDKRREFKKPIPDENGNDLFVIPTTGDSKSRFLLVPLALSAKYNIPEVFEYLLNFKDQDFHILALRLAEVYNFSKGAGIIAKINLIDWQHYLPYLGSFYLRIISKKISKRRILTNYKNLDKLSNIYHPLLSANQIKRVSSNVPYMEFVQKIKLLQEKNYSLLKKDGSASKKIIRKFLLTKDMSRAADEYQRRITLEKGDKSDIDLTNEKGQHIIYDITKNCDFSFHAIKKRFKVHPDLEIDKNGKRFIQHLWDNHCYSILSRYRKKNNSDFNLSKRVPRSREFIEDQLLRYFSGFDYVKYMGLDEKESKMSEILLKELLTINPSLKPFPKHQINSILRLRDLFKRREDAAALNAQNISKLEKNKNSALPKYLYSTRGSDQLQRTNLNWKTLRVEKEVENIGNVKNSRIGKKFIVSFNNHEIFIFKNSIGSNQLVTSIKDKDIHIFDVSFNQKFIIASLERSVRIYDHSLKVIIDIPNPIEKAAHNIMLHKNTIYALDNFVTPVFVFTIDIKNPKKPKVSKPLGFDGVNYHLDQQWISKTGDWIFLGSYNHLAGSGQQLYVVRNGDTDLKPQEIHSMSRFKKKKKWYNSLDHLFTGEDKKFEILDFLSRKDRLAIIKKFDDIYLAQIDAKKGDIKLENLVNINHLYKKGGRAKGHIGYSKPYLILEDNHNDTLRFYSESDGTNLFTLEIPKRIRIGKLEKSTEYH